MDFYKKIKLTLLFTFGLFLFWFNQVYAVDYTASTTYGSFKFYIPDNVLQYVYNTPEYSKSGVDYGWFVILNSNTNNYELYFTPWSSGTPIQAFLTYNRWHFNGTFSYIKYESSDGYNWSRSTGTISNQDLYVYKDSNNQYYSWSWDYSIYFYFIQNNGGWINFPMPTLFTAPTIDATSPDYVDGNINVFRVYSGSITPDEPMTFKILDGNNDITFATILGDGGWTGSYQDSGSYSGQYMYTITYRFLEPNPINIVSGNTYTLELTYSSPNGSQSTSYSWTFNLSADTTQNIQDNTQQDIKNTLEETQSFLTNSNVDYDTIVGNFEESRVDFNFTGTNYLTTFFQFLNNIFVTDNYQDFVFTIPNSNGQSITIPADYMETHIPSAIIGLIRIFYWYMISRYIVKDIFGIIDRLRAGKVTDIDNNDIKADML